MEFARGMLTENIQAMSREYLGREITVRELRLFPYIDYVIKNGGYADRSRMSREELDILHSYNKETQLKRAFDGYIWVSREFYAYLQNVLWEAYVGTKLGEEGA